MARVVGDSTLLSLVNPTGPMDVTGTALTVSGWVKLSDLTNGFITHKWVSNNGSFGLDTQSNILRLRINATGEGVSGATALTVGPWYHVAARKNGNSGTAAAVFVNGVLDGTGSSTNPMPDTTNDFVIGGNGSTFTIHGSVAEFCYWNFALTDAEIAALAKGASPFRVHPKNIIGYFPLWGAAGASAGEPDMSGVGVAQTLGLTGSVAVANHAPVARFSS